MCLLSKHPLAAKVWHDEDAIRQELKQEALTKSFTETIMAMYTAHAALVDKYLTGEANAVEEETRRTERRAVNEGKQDERIDDFNKEQLLPCLAIAQEDLYKTRYLRCFGDIILDFGLAFWPRLQTN